MQNQHQLPQRGGPSPRPGLHWGAQGNTQRRPSSAQSALFSLGQRKTQASLTMSWARSRWLESDIPWMACAGIPTGQEGWEACPVLRTSPPSGQSQHLGRLRPVPGLAVTPSKKWRPHPSGSRHSSLHDTRGFSPLLTKCPGPGGTGVPRGACCPDGLAELWMSL